LLFTLDAATDLCFDFDHSDALLGQIIGKRDSEVMDKQAYFPLVFRQAVNQGAAFSSLGSALSPRLLLWERI